jgi:hypothetical protein
VGILSNFDMRLRRVLQDCKLFLFVASAHVRREYTRLYVLILFVRCNGNYFCVRERERERQRERESL